MLCNFAVRYPQTLRLANEYLIYKYPRVTAGAGVPSRDLAEVVGFHAYVTGLDRINIFQQLADRRVHFLLRHIRFDLCDLRESPAVRRCFEFDALGHPYPRAGDL